MTRSCLCCAVCALLLFCLGQSAWAAAGTEADDGELCAAGEPVPPMSLAPAARLLRPAAALDAGDHSAPRPLLCVAGANAAGQCRVDGPAGSGSDPRPASPRVVRVGCLAAQQRPGAPPPRVLPRLADSDLRRCPGYARGIERPPRAP